MGDYMSNNNPNKINNNFSIMSILTIVFKFFTIAIFLLIMLFVAVIIHFIVSFDNCWNFTIFKIAFPIFVICFGIMIFIKNNSKVIKLLKICIFLFIINIINIIYYAFFSIKVETSLLLKKYNIPKNEIEIIEITQSNNSLFGNHQNREIKYDYNDVQFNFWYSNDGWITNYEELLDFEKNNKQNINNINKILDNNGLDYYVILDKHNSYYNSSKNSNSYEYNIFINFKDTEVFELEYFFTHMNAYISNQLEICGDDILYNVYFVNDFNIFSKMINKIQTDIEFFNSESFLSSSLVCDIFVLSDTNNGFDISIFNNYVNSSNIIFYYRSESNNVYHSRFIVYGAKDI